MKRERRKDCNISWSRRNINESGNIVYIFYFYQFHWKIKFLHVNMSRKQRALHLRAQRKKFKKFMWRYNRVGGCQ